MGKGQNDDQGQMFAQVPSMKDLTMQVEEQESQYNTGRHGYEYYNDGGQNEVEAVIRRLKSEDKTKVLTEADFNQLRAVKPLEFADQVTAAQKKSMGHFKKKSYNRKLKKYKQERAAWDQDQDGSRWYAKLDELEQRVQDANDRYEAEEEEKQLELDRFGNLGKQSVRERTNADTRLAQLRQEDPEYARIYARDRLSDDPKAMDDFYAANGAKVLSPVMKAEQKLRDEDVKVLGDLGTSLATSYTGSLFKIWNDSLRDNNPAAMAPQAVTLKMQMYRCRINRDLVVRRGVKGVRSLAFMAGLDDPYHMTEDEIRDAFQRKLDQNPGMIITDRGFVSTSLHTDSFPAQRDVDDPTSQVGIEFMILVRKGVCAANVSGVSQIDRQFAVGAENEVLINAGTKFRVIRAAFNDGTPEQEMPIHNGVKGTWKIYLEALPIQGEGVPRDVAQ